MPFVGELEEFQQEAVDRALDWGRALIAVTMGGGKTPITIAIIEELLDAKEVGAGLVITPASLKHQWNGDRGFPLFAPEAKVVVIDGDFEHRREQYIRAQHWAEYIVMGYSQVMDDWQWVKKLPADFIVMDEVQAIKNPGSQRSAKMEKLLAKARRRGNPIFGLTGQPLEDRPEDVFHVCAGIDPEVLGNPHIFDRTFVKRNKYGKATSFDNLPLLHRTLEEKIMVRVGREAIREFLPEVQHESYVVPFDEPTFEVYRTIVRDLLGALKESKFSPKFDVVAHYAGAQTSAAEAAQRGRIMARLACARMLCDHPMLVQMSADLFDASASGEMGALKAGSAYAYELRERGVLKKLPRGRGPKMSEVVSEVFEILDADPENKVVLFSFYKPTLSWLADAFKRRTQSVLYHGGVTAKKRNELKERFNADPKTRVFLSTDAGGSGVDLPAGNYLLNYDLPFSAGKLEQRNARIDRMSSTHAHTVVQDWLMEGSVEEHYADVVEARRATARAAIDGKGNRAGTVRLPTASLTRFLEDWLEEHPG